MTFMMSRILKFIIRIPWPHLLPLIQHDSTHVADFNCTSSKYSTLSHIVAPNVGRGPTPSIESENTDSVNNFEQTTSDWEDDDVIFNSNAFPLCKRNGICIQASSSPPHHITPHNDAFVLHAMSFQDRARFIFVVR